MSTQPITRFTFAEYLEIERQAEHRSEFCDGEMFAMSGTSRWHNLVAGSLYAHLRAQTRGRGCRVFMSDLRVQVAAADFYVYPDVVGVCGREDYLDGQLDTLTNPTFLAEVLSPSTEAYDRSKKSEHFRTIPSLQQYALIAQDRMKVDLYTRQEGGGWLLTEASLPTDLLALTSLGCHLTLAELYEDVDFAAAAP